MNLRISLLIVSFILIGQSFSFAQKKQLQLKDPYTNAAVYPDRMNQLQWVKGQDAYTFIEDQKIMKVMAGKKAKELYSFEKFSNALKKNGMKASKRFPTFVWENENSFRFIKKDTLYLFDLNTEKIQMLNVYPTASEYVKLQPKTKDVAFTEGQNLYIYRNGKKITVTNDNMPGIVNGQTVSRSEFGITHGIFWSPKGNKLAYYKKDESQVTEYPLLDYSVRPAKVKNTRYPMAGMTSEIISVYVFDIKTNKSIKLKTGPADDKYLTNVSWGPNEKYIYIAVLNRDQNHMWLKQYDAQTGDFIKTLFEETNDKYVEPQEPLYFLNDNANEFVWMSRRDGFNHAYLYNTDGKLLKQLTKGNWLITKYLGFDKGNKNMYFMSTKESPIQRHLYVLNMKTLDVKKLTKVRGTHNIMLSDSKKFFIDIYSNYDEIVREYALYQNNGKEKAIILKNRNPLKDFNLGEMTISTLKGNDGTDLYYRLIKPANFDPNKKYPVFIYVYGGPHAQLINDSWLGGGGFFLQYMASQGYIVFTLDNRGSANRGFAFESVIHRQCGQAEMEDQMTGVKFIKSLPYADTNRIGVNGWSYGGFMTTSLKCNYPKTFKVGVAGGPVIDWKYYEVMYGERYMDRPEENPEGYKKTSLLSKAQNLEGHMLIIHGGQDPTVVWQNSLLFIDKAIKARKQVDYFVYPYSEHNVRGIDRLHLETKIFNYFEDYLK